MTNGTNPGDAPGLTLMRARDGDILVILDGAGMVEGTPVDVGVSGGTLRVTQGGGATLAGGEVGPDAALDLARARRVSVVEFYPGETPEADRFVVHHDARVGSPTG